MQSRMMTCWSLRRILGYFGFCVLIAGQALTQNCVDFSGSLIVEGQSFHPVLSPKGIDYCQACNCQKGTVSCEWLSAGCPECQNRTAHNMSARIAARPSCCPNCTIEGETDPPQLQRPSRCVVNGKVHRHGEKWRANPTNPCSMCRCENGRVVCYLTRCNKTCPCGQYPVRLPQARRCCPICTDLFVGGVSNCTHSSQQPTARPEIGAPKRRSISPYRCKSWRQWSACSQTCGTGMRRRTRRCKCRHRLKFKEKCTQAMLEMASVEDDQCEIRKCSSQTPRKGRKCKLKKWKYKVLEMEYVDKRASSIVTQILVILNVENGHSNNCTGSMHIWGVDGFQRQRTTCARFEQFRNTNNKVRFRLVGRTRHSSIKKLASFEDQIFSGRCTENCHVEMEYLKKKAIRLRKCAADFRGSSLKL